MKNEFKDKDRVRCIDHGIFISVGKIYTILIAFEKHILIIDDDDNKVSHSSDLFELVERQIDGVWFKAEELYIHENALPPDDEKPNSFSIECQKLIEESNKLVEKCKIDTSSARTITLPIQSINDSYTVETETTVGPLTIIGSYKKMTLNIGKTKITIENDWDDEKISRRNINE